MLFCKSSLCVAAPHALFFHNCARMFAKQMLSRSALPSALRSTNLRTFSSNAPVIVAANRTPIGSFMGGLKGFQGHELGTIAIRDLLQRAGVSGDDVNEVILGNVIQGNQGQAPARQAAVRAGVTLSAGATTINKVCASVPHSFILIKIRIVAPIIFVQGMKSVMMAAQSVSLGQNVDGL